MFISSSRRLVGAPHPARRPAGRVHEVHRQRRPRDQLGRRGAEALQDAGAARAGPDDGDGAGVSGQGVSPGADVTQDFAHHAVPGGSTRGPELRLRSVSPDGTRVRPTGRVAGRVWDPALPGGRDVVMASVMVRGSCATRRVAAGAAGTAEASGSSCRGSARSRTPATDDHPPLWDGSRCAVSPAPPPRPAAHRRPDPCPDRLPPPAPGPAAAPPSARAASASSAGCRTRGRPSCASPPAAGRHARRGGRRSVPERAGPPGSSRSGSRAVSRRGWSCARASRSAGAPGRPGAAARASRARRRTRGGRRPTARTPSPGRPARSPASAISSRQRVEGLGERRPVLQVGRAAAAPRRTAPSARPRSPRHSAAFHASASWTRCGSSQGREVPIRRWSYDARPGQGLFAQPVRPPRRPASRARSSSRTRAAAGVHHQQPDPAEVAAVAPAHGRRVGVGPRGEVAQRRRCRRALSRTAAYSASAASSAGERLPRCW